MAEAMENTCNICQKHFASSQAVQNHMKMRHANAEQHPAKVEQNPAKIQEPTEPENAPEQICTFNSEVADEEQNFSGAEEFVSQESFVCNECGYTFVSAELLEEHKDTAHVNEVPHGSPEGCASQFLSVELLEYQYDTDAKFEDVKCFDCGKNIKLKCDKCNVYGFNYEYYKMHMKDAHHKAFMCDLCSRAFTKRSTVPTHKASFHSSHRPFSCYFCMHTFDTAISLRKHKSKCKIYIDHIIGEKRRCQFVNNPQQRSGTPQDTSMDYVTASTNSKSFLLKNAIRAKAAAANLQDKPEPKIFPIPKTPPDFAHINWPLVGDVYDCFLALKKENNLGVHAMLDKMFEKFPELQTYYGGKRIREALYYRLVNINKRNELRSHRQRHWYRMLKFNPFTLKAETSQWREYARLNLFPPKKQNRKSVSQKSDFKYNDSNGSLTSQLEEEGALDSLAKDDVVTESLPETIDSCVGEDEIKETLSAETLTQDVTKEEEHDENKPPGLVTDNELSMETD